MPKAPTVCVKKASIGLQPPHIVVAEMVIFRGERSKIAATFPSNKLPDALGVAEVREGCAALGKGARQVGVHVDGEPGGGPASPLPGRWGVKGLCALSRLSPGPEGGVRGPEACEELVCDGRRVVYLEQEWKG